MELIYLLSLIVFLPALGGLVIAFLPGNKTDLIRYVTFGVCLAVLVLSCYAFLAPQSAAYFSTEKAEMQSAFNIPWIPSFDIEYFMGVDGISLPLVMLTALVSFLAMWASW